MKKPKYIRFSELISKFLELPESRKNFREVVEKFTSEGELSGSSQINDFSLRNYSEITPN
ncbi:MAG: hypothetical protein U5N85_14355 [Arcicella sp.]|nr:hypothetical protein [Arcicella sp.]